MTVLEFKNRYTRLLDSSASPALDIEVLLCFCLKCGRTFLLMNRDMRLSGEQLQWLVCAVEKRRTGLPVAYITGHKEFYGYDFSVTPDVLIPKPDTEILVCRAVDLITDKILSGSDAVLTVCDMCTGSGCIALSVLRSLIDEPSVPRERIPAFTLVDISSKALEVAERNAAALIPERFLNRVRFRLGNLFDGDNFTYNFILTNPPYVPGSTARKLLCDGRAEPLLALDGDVSESGGFSGSSDGLGVIRRLLPQCAGRLVRGGTVLMETGEYNARAAAAAAEKCGFSGVRIHRDLEEQLRVVEAVI